MFKIASTIQERNFNYRATLREFTLGKARVACRFIEETQSSSVRPFTVKQMNGLRRGFNKWRDKKRGWVKTKTIQWQAKRWAF